MALANSSLGNDSISPKKGDTMPKKAKWLAVTGLDGSGKTHLVANLADHYREKGFSVQTAHLPYDTHLDFEVLPKLKQPYADRLLFALDNYIFDAQYKAWETEYDLIITQRCYFDSFVHGAVQGYDYDFIGSLMQIENLHTPNVMIHLVCSAATAYARIKDDPDADKFEYPAYIRKQEIQTRRGYDELMYGNLDLFAFSSVSNTLIDTTYMTIPETFDESIRYLEDIHFMK